MTNIEKQHEIVKTSLFQFVNTHIPGADMSVVDEIVLNYVIAILEEASQDPCFDVEGMNSNWLILFIFPISIYHVKATKWNITLLLTVYYLFKLNFV